jgi:hypothetical protein
MPDKKLDEKKAVELLEKVYELFQLHNLDYQHYTNSHDILNSKGELFKKIRFSALNGYDIIDVLNSFKIALTLSYMNPDFDESVMRLLDNTQKEITSKVLEVFMPDEILDWVDSFEESATYDDYFLVYVVDNITGNSKKLVTDDDKFYYQKGIIGQHEFNCLSKVEKRVYIINELYQSDTAKFWYNKLNQYIEDGGGFLEFYEILKKINLNDKNLFMLQVKKNLGLL